MSFSWRLLEQRPPAGPRVFQTFAADTETGAIALLAKEGYRAIRYNFEMARPFDTPIPDLLLPGGLEVRAVAPEQYRQVSAALNEAFRDHWGHSESAAVCRLRSTIMLTSTLSTTLELPALPTLSEFEFRALRRADLPALYELLLAVEQADGRDLVQTLEDLQREFDDPWSNPETDALLALTHAGQTAGLARTFQNPQPEDEVRCYLSVEIHPTQRANGLEETLLDWADERGRQRLLTAAEALPRVLRSGIQDTQTKRQAQLEQRGFGSVRYFYRMQRDLSEPIPAVQLPGDLALRVYTPELSEAVQAAFNEAFRDHWSFDPITNEDWQMFFIERSSFRPDLTYVVMDGNEVAGFSLNGISLEENARRGRSEGWIEELAVRRPWRKRGVATALLCASMHAFKAEGLRHAMLGVDTQNLSGALRVYERVGFRPVKRFIQFEKMIEQDLKA